MQSPFAAVSPFHTLLLLNPLYKEDAGDDISVYSRGQGSIGDRRDANSGRGD